MQLFLACFHIYYIYYYSHCTMQGLKVLRISLSELHLNNDKWDKKVRLGVNIFDKRILESCKFISDTVLQNTALSTTIFSLQPAEYKLVSIMHNAQPIRILFSMFPFSLFLARGKGKKSIEKPFFSALLFSLFPSRVYYHVIPQETGESCIRTCLF